MYCLLCNFVAPTDEILFNHYVGYHRINPDNYFFNCLFKREVGLLCKECCRCEDFLVRKSDKAEHKFLKHYAVGERKPPEEKPINVIKKGDITIYQISFKDHSADYDFYDPESIIDDFLFNIKYIFQPLNKFRSRRTFQLKTFKTRLQMSQRQPILKV